jgi:hypothetical protein
MTCGPSQLYLTTLYCNWQENVTCTVTYQSIRRPAKYMFHLYYTTNLIKHLTVDFPPQRLTTASD